MTIQSHFLTGALIFLAMGCASTESQGPKLDRSLLRRELARTLADHGEWASATRPLVELAAERPQDAQVRVALGTVYREQGLYDEAEQAYSAALRLKPKLAEAYSGRGIVRELRGDSGDAALDDFAAAASLAPQDASLHNNLGFALYLRGRYAEATQAFRAALALDPSARRIRNNLGFAYGRLGQMDKARREFERAGEVAAVLNNLGYLMEQAQDVGAACDYYRRAGELDPNLSVTRNNFERACEGASFAKRSSL